MKLSVKNVSFGYGETHIFKDLSFESPSGSVLWLGGRSGVGKSTFLKLISGLLAAESGEISWDNQPLSNHSEKNRSQFRRKFVGYGDQEINLISNWTVAQNLQLAAGGESPIDLLKELEIDSFLHALVANLSGGQKQRVLLARLILQNPAILLLDEPTAHLDDRTTEIAMKAIAKHCSKSTTFIVSHDARIGSWVGQQITMELGGLQPRMHRGAP